MIELLDKMESFLSTPLKGFKGVGEKSAKILEKNGILTVRDIIFNIPERWIDKRHISKIRDIRAGDLAYIKAKVLNSGSWIAKGFLNKRVNGFTATVYDGTGYLTLRWFYDPPAFIKNMLSSKAEIYIYGKVNIFKTSKEISHPEIELASSDFMPQHKIIPSYNGIPKGISEGVYRRLMEQAVSAGRDILISLLPQKIKKVFNIIEIGEALYNIHFPDNDFSRPIWEEKKSPYHLSLLYEELFLFFSIFAMKKEEYERIQIPPLKINYDVVNSFLKELPYPLTDAQKKVIEQIKNDLCRPTPMHRLLQGDVGSGKTIVAIISALSVISAKKQVALMVPTEILAEQHFNNIRELLKNQNIKAGLITSSLRKKDKEQILREICSGDMQFIVGTHSLIQEDVSFRELGLAIIDEQHRFGVEQRNLLRKKGNNPHILYMTATPIPRTLTMTLYGDLELSVIDQLPPGRKPVRTIVLPESQRERAFKLIESEIRRGFQCYIVYPVIEEDNALELKSAKEMYQVVKDKFSYVECRLLHGKLSQEEKDEIMAGFKSGLIKILVSTTVIEVGVDVPRATVMVIEHGERFGLSQLHQLRGRIGRGGEESYCVVLVETKKLSKEGRERLIYFRDTADGFKLAEFDLKLRGPGEIAGTRQSGMPEFRFADLIKHAELIEKMKNNVETYLKSADSEYIKQLPRIQQLFFNRNFEYTKVG